MLANGFTRLWEGLVVDLIGSPANWTGNKSKQPTSVVGREKVIVTGQREIC